MGPSPATTARIVSVGLSANCVPLSSAQFKLRQSNRLAVLPMRHFASSTALLPPGIQKKLRRIPMFYSDEDLPE